MSVYRHTIGRWENGLRRYRVTLSMNGPRGGRRPPMADVDVYADTQEEATGKAKSWLNRRLRVEVRDA